MGRRKYLIFFFFFFYRNKLRLVIFYLLTFSYYSAWPIGVTMVGIHERSAREKLHQSDQKTHILSDEITRKYLQAIKRCLSFAQVRWPPDDQLQLMG